MHDLAEADIGKLSLKIDLFRRSLSEQVGYEELLRTLLLQTVAATDASGGAIYLHDEDRLESFGTLHHPSLRRRLVGLTQTQAATGSLLLDTPNRLAAPLWRRGHPIGVVYVTGRQTEEGRGAFTALDKALLAAFGATASIALERALLEQENQRLRARTSQAVEVPFIVGAAPSIASLLEQVTLVAQMEINVPVLIEGENGTGKELIARALHRQSPRRDGPFVAVNCAAIPKELLESELFGHEKGAFTGAVAAKPGKFEQADGGTIFLDEIGEMALDVQAKLLRVLEDGTFTRVGGTKTTRSDFRLVSATNKRLREEVKKGTFREDLFYRLTTFELVSPPLRERREDIPLLAAHFLGDLNARSQQRNVEGFAPAALRTMREYDWPGNVRQLRRIVERAFVLCDRPLIDVQHLPPEVVGGADRQPLVFEEVVLLEEAIARYVQFAYTRMEGHKTNTMKQLGIDYRRLQRYLEKAGGKGNGRSTP